MTARAADARRKMKGHQSRNLLAALLLVLCTLPVMAQDPADYADVYEQVSRSVVDIHAEDGGGTGTIISPDGYILTNAHVVYDYDYDEVVTSIQVRLFDGRETEAEVIGYDHYSDIGLLKINLEESLPAAKIGDSDRLRVGNPALVIGHPYLSYSYDYSLSSGVVSSLNRMLPEPMEEVTDICAVPWIQTDAVINGGNSGGPLLNSDGEIIGVISWGDNWDDDSGVNFAVPINFAMEVQKELREHGEIGWGIMGVYLDYEITSVTDEEGYDLSGLVVNRVNKGSGAEAAGIEVGDVIIEYNGEEVDDLYFACEREGTEVLVIVIRDGQELDFLVTLSPIEGEGFLALLDQ